MVRKIKPIKTNTTNITYVAKGCRDLPATQHVLDNKLITETCWELTEEEKQKIMETGKIYYSIMGHTVIPMMLHTDSLIE